MKTRLLILPVLLVLAGPAQAQEHQHSPYAGEQDRTIKALSVQEIEGYRTGQGMGFAMAAELNQYPGPKHVLELADDLDLTDEQRAETQQIFEAMRAEAIPLGEQLVAKEAELDTLFAEGRAEAEAVQALLREIGAVRADLRFAHLNAHLAMKALLTRHQIHRYDQLRGYADGMNHEHH